MIREFIRYYKPHKRLFFFDMLCSFLIAMCDMFYPLITKSIINDYVPNRNLRLLAVWSGVLLLIYAFKAVLNYIVSYWGHIVGVRMQGDMRRDMFTHLQKLPFSFFDENKTGQIMSRLMNDLFDVSELAHHGPEDIFISAVMLIGSFIALSGINLRLTLIIYAFIPIIVFIAVKLRKRMRRAFSEMRAEVAEVNANVETAVSGVRVSRAYTSERHEIEKFNAANTRFIAARGRAYKAMGTFNSVMTLSTDILYLVALVAGGLCFYYGFSDPANPFAVNGGEFTAFILYMAMLLKPINRIISLFEQLQNGMTGFARFREIMECPAEEDAPDAVELHDVCGEIDFRDVSFSYPAGDTGKNVLHSLSLHIESGKTVALVGPSGGGKSTLCNLIPRFYEVDSGVITLDGVDITKIKRDNRCGKARRDTRLYNVARKGIRYSRGRTRDKSFRRAEAADKHSAGISERPSRAHTRRGDKRSRQYHRNADTGFAFAAGEGQNGYRCRPSAYDGAQCRRNTRDDLRRYRRTRHTRKPYRSGRNIFGALQPQPSPRGLTKRRIWVNMTLKLIYGAT